MNKCIYCLRELTYSKFNREHIIPKAFGTFENNLVLHNIVCEDCNQYFGDNLELVLGRGSLEALGRIEEGDNSFEIAKDFKKERISLKVSSADHLNGLHLWFGVPGVIPMLQVRFRSIDGEGFVYVKLFDLENPNYEIPVNADILDVAVLAYSIESKQKIIKALANRGISLDIIYEEGIADRGSEISEVEVEIIVDEFIFRAMAKIVFNYLAYVAGPNFALSSQFDKIREFVRYDKQLLQPMVSVNTIPILTYDQQHMRQTNGHIIVIDWDHRSNVIIGKLSFFNWATYRIVLTRNCSRMVFRNIRSGHHYNFGSNQVEKLVGLRLR